MCQCSRLGAIEGQNRCPHFGSEFQQTNRALPCLPCRKKAFIRPAAITCTDGKSIALIQTLYWATNLLDIRKKEQPQTFCSHNTFIRFACSSWLSPRSTFNQPPDTM